MWETFYKDVLTHSTFVTLTPSMLICYEFDKSFEDKTIVT